MFSPCQSGDPESLYYPHNTLLSQVSNCCPACSQIIWRRCLSEAECTVSGGYAKTPSSLSPDFGPFFVALVIPGAGLSDPGQRLARIAGVPAPLLTAAVTIVPYDPQWPLEFRRLGLFWGRTVFRQCYKCLWQNSDGGICHSFSSCAILWWQKITLLQEGLPIGMRHFMVTKLAGAFFLKST